MFYKCYFHTKTDGAHLCRGCKLPICDECQHELGFCPECMRKRDAVDDLRNLRKSVAAKSKVTSSTTARLRLAIRQVGPIAKRGRLAPGMIDTQLLATGALNADAWQEQAMAVDAKVPRHFKEMMDQRKNQWTYDPDRVAYRGVAGAQAGAPARAKAPVQRTSVGGRITRPRVEEAPARDLAWAKPFVMGLGVGLVVVLGATFGQGLFKAGPKAKAKPIYTNLDKAELKLVREINGTDPDLQRARAKAAARRALMAEAFAEADGVARRVAATESARASAEAARAAAAARYAAAQAARVRTAPPPAAAPPVIHAAAPAPRVSYARPAHVAPAAHQLPMPGGSDGSRGVTIRMSTPSNQAQSWKKSGGMLVTSW